MKQRLEFYTPSEDIAVAGRVLKKVNGTPTLSGLLPHVEKYIPFPPLVSVGIHTDPKIPVGPNLSRPTLKHGRSYHLDIPSLNQETIYTDHGEEVETHFPTLFTDQYGNYFMDINTKGNNLSNPGMRPEKRLPYGFQFQGLQDDACMERVLRASDIMRRNGIDTEIILQLTEPIELPYEGKLMPIARFKQELARDFSPYPQEKRAVNDALKRVSFHITTRGVQVNERVWDLTEGRIKPRGFWQIMQKTFGYVNQVEKYKNLSGDITQAEFYHILDESDDDDFEQINIDSVTNYFTGKFAKVLGRNYGKLHSLGLLHHYPHAGNISLTGGIYDLDSVDGTILEMDDEPNPDRSLTEEAHRVYINILSQLRAISSSGFIKLDISQEKRFEDNFFNSYIFSRINGSPILEISSLLSMAKDFGFANVTAQTLEAAELFKNSVDHEKHEDMDNLTKGLLVVVENFGPSEAGIIIQVLATRGDADTQGPIYNDIATNLVKELGWDKDVMSHLNKIRDLWDGFSAEDDLKPLTYFCDLSSDQLGWNPHFPNAIEKIRDFYLEADKARLEHEIQENLAVGEGGYGRQGLIRLALEEHANNSDHTFSNMLKKVTINFAQKEMRERYGLESESITDKYGKGVLDTLTSMIAQRFYLEINKIPEEEIVTYDVLSANRIDVLNKYLGTEEDNFDIIPFAYDADLSLGLEFENPEDRGTKYLERALAAIGFEYSFDQNLIDMLPGLNTKIKDIVLITFTDTLKTMGAKLFDDFPIESTIAQFNIMSHDPVSTYINFAEDEIEKDVRLKMSSDLPSLLSKYNPENIETVIGWIVRREVSKLYMFTPEQENDIKQNLKDLLEDIRKSAFAVKAREHKTR